MHFDIAIIGYGPVGAVAANMFGASGHDVVVIEPKKEKISSIQEKEISLKLKLGE